MGDEEFRRRLEQFFENEASCTNQYAKKYADILIKENIPTIEKLQKRLDRMPNFLLEKNFGEFDVEDIKEALEKRQRANNQNEAAPVIPQPVPNRATSDQNYQIFRPEYFDKRIIRKLGAGGMGAAYLCRCLQSELVVKEVH
jgi:hypothetical protein